MSKYYSRLLLLGLQRTNSDDQIDSDDVGVETISTFSVDFRDAVHRLAIHAGYAAYFDSNRASGAWCIRYSELPSLAEPVLESARDIIQHSKPHGVTVWCPTVEPFNTIIVRRVEKDEDGIVTKATLPIIIGNCRVCGKCGLKMDHQSERAKSPLRSINQRSAAFGLNIKFLFSPSLFFFPFC